VKKPLAGEASVRRCWVVLLEVQTTAQLELEAVEAVLANLADRFPSALYSPERCAVQFLVEDADGPDVALADGIAIWRAAARDFPDGDLVRAEVKTPAELEAEYHDDPEGSVHVPADQRALAAAYEATRRLVRSTSPREVVSVLSALVRQLGGTTVRPLRRSRTPAGSSTCCASPRPRACPRSSTSPTWTSSCRRSPGAQPGVPLAIWLAMRSTSSRWKRRWPPRVTMQAMRPSCAHRLTVLGDTCRRRATSPGVRYSDFGCDSDTDALPVSYSRIAYYGQVA
jgi:hypothetical protein